ncbi:mevalonate kinase [Bacteriovoracaceae bacterium]|nr:mevalonate kinase [Bacteriovoracaceae bacterium]
MNTDTSKKFNSKVLLFGEYTVIKQSMALSIPFDLFDGGLTFKKEQQKVDDSELKAFSKYMHKLDREGSLPFEFDSSSFQFDVGQGLHFLSTIPMGYGVGSSGALCAALYDRYSTPVEKNTLNPSQLKKNFALMENHFHGSSSGVDPLISYLNRPILIDKGQKMGSVELPTFTDRKGGLFLLNTGRSRKTEPLVNLFLEKCKNKDFENSLINDLLPLTNLCIDSFLKGNSVELVSNFRRLSGFQFELMEPMIPTLFHDIWRKGNETGEFSLKLCGAGGGGFILGITPDFKMISEALEDYEVRPLIKF